MAFGMSTPDYENSLPEFEPHHARFLQNLYIPQRDLCPVFVVAALACAGLAICFRIVWRIDVDWLFIAVIAVFLLLTLGLVAGCAALERRR
jgi:hypothetical protein